MPDPPPTGRDILIDPLIGVITDLLFFVIWFLGASFRMFFGR